MRLGFWVYVASIAPACEINTIRTPESEIKSHTYFKASNMSERISPCDLSLSMPFMRVLYMPLIKAIKSSWDRFRR